MLYLLLLLSSPALVLSQDDLAPLDFSSLAATYDCPEPNGKFPDPEQCDLYYLCTDNVAEAVLCPDGLLFDYSNPNHEQCVFPQNIDCGAREFVQEPTPGLDERCPRANGVFDHENPNECSKFYTCDKGEVFEMFCPATLVFDNSIGGCVRADEASREAKVCGTGDEGSQAQLKTVEGFTCPGKPKSGPQGLLQAHPVFAHPTDCRYFFTCFFGTDPNKFGCAEGQVFDEATQVCKPAEEVRECSCWYECPDDCETGECAPDCTCLSRSDLAALTESAKRRK